MEGKIKRKKKNNAKFSGHYDCPRTETVREHALCSHQKQSWCGGGGFRGKVSNKLLSHLVFSLFRPLPHNLCVSPGKNIGERESTTQIHRGREGHTGGGGKEGGREERKREEKEEGMLLRILHKKF